MTLDALYLFETLYLWKDQHMYHPPIIAADAKSSSNMDVCEVLIGVNAANHTVCPSQWKFDLANCDHVIVEGGFFLPSSYWVQLYLHQKIEPLYTWLKSFLYPRLQHARMEDL